MLWLTFAVLTAIAVASILWPLAKTPRGFTRRETGIAIYKAQLAEIERDEAHVSWRRKMRKAPRPKRPAA
jgi:cytochrome c-type biogenesis protein CcmI